MAVEPFLKQLSEFYKAARHLWGRCPACRHLFRLSDAAISYGNEPPRDWLRRVQQQEGKLAGKRTELDDWQADVERREYELSMRERELESREKNLDRVAKEKAKELLKSGAGIKDLLRQARQEGANRSRSTLLGKLFERLGPFLQRFNHDPRDIRAIMDPIDYVCFDGLTASRRVERVTFVEVKVGTSTPSTTQRSIIQAVRDGRVATEIWQFGKRGIPIPQQLLLTAGSESVLRRPRAGDE